LRGDTYTTLLGQVLGNFHGLEMAIRAFLATRDPRNALDDGQEFKSLVAGDTVAETPFTDYSSLGQLIANFNSLVPSHRRIDPGLVDLRDALAHGRLWSPTGAFPLHLLKFGKPAGGRVKVTLAVTVTEAWLHEQRDRVLEALVRAHGAPGKTPLRRARFHRFGF
jgi:hypothetical protein